jgi:hypothetical protein
MDRGLRIILSRNLSLTVGLALVALGTFAALLGGAAHP